MLFPDIHMAPSHNSFRSFLKCAFSVKPFQASYLISNSLVFPIFLPDLFLISLEFISNVYYFSHLVVYSAHQSISSMKAGHRFILFTDVISSA